MKKVMRKYLYVLTAAMSAAILFSCSKEVDVINTNDSTELGKTVTLTITASHDNGTRTYLDGDSVKWSESNETLAVFEENGTDVAKSTSEAGVTTDGGTTMTFATQLATATGSDFTYYAFYPSSAWYSNKTPSSIAINTPATQTPLATSFDPAADLLIAKPVETASQATSLSMRFARAIAVGKMTIKNLQSSEKVIQVKFSAKIGSNDVFVAGRTPFDLGTAEPADVYGKNVSEKSIILDYNNLNLTANSSMDAFFTCYPFELGAGDSFTVEVKTPTNTFVRTVTIPENRSLAFNAGELSTFSVDMSSVSGTANAVNLCYAYLAAEEFHEAGGTNSYGNVTVEKEHGDKWETYAAYNSSSISIRNNSSTNDSYVKLPEFTDNISSVIVTLGSAIASGKTLTLESSKTDNTGSIASLTTVANQTTYTFDLSGTSVKTAYLRSSGAQALVSKIEVFAGTDTRDATQAGPSSVSASVNAVTPNTINVTWTTASGATGYEVTLTPDEGEAITQTVESSVTSASFTGLEFNTSYTPSVVALADLYLCKANSSPVEGNPVTTGAPGSGQTPESPYTVAQVRAAMDAGTLGACYVRGVVCNASSGFSAGYGNGTFYISDDGQTNSDQFEAYRINFLENKAWVNGNTQIAVGDVVVINCVGGVKIYTKEGVSTYENESNAYLYSLNSATSETVPTITSTDISGITTAGVTGATTSITLTNASDWTASVTPDGTIVTAASITGTTITYSVAANTGTARTGSITVSLSKDGRTDVTAVISVSQKGTGPVTLIIDGSKLTTTATTSESTLTYDGVDVVFSSGAKKQSSTGDKRFTDDAILIGKNGANIHATVPGTITKFEIYSNKGASTKVSIGVNFSSSAITAYNSSAANTYTATLTTADLVYDCTEKLPSNANSFWYQVTNANNSQVEFRITYNPSN